MKKTFVMVHGSWHGGWAWQQVIRQLSDGGHSAEAPTLPGHGPATMRSGIRIRIVFEESSVTFNSTGWKTSFWSGIALADQSYRRSPKKSPSRIARTVFVDALIVRNGHCVFDELPAEYVALFNQFAEASSDNTMLIPREIWRDNFIQDASKPVALSWRKQLYPRPNQVNLDKLDLRQFYSLTIPRSFIHCRHDKALPPGYLHPRMSSRLGAFRLLEMNGSHELMFMRRAELADKIIDASTD